MILYFAADLIWATRIKSTAEAVCVGCRPVRSEQMLLARLADSDVRALVADLDKPDEAIALIRRLREWESSEAGQAPPIRVVAFGPHVNKADLQAAREAGADDAMARGAFEHNLGEILVNLSGRSRTG